MTGSLRRLPLLWTIAGLTLVLLSPVLLAAIGYATPPAAQTGSPSPSAGNTPVVDFTPTSWLGTSVGSASVSPITSSEAPAPTLTSSGPSPTLNSASPTRAAQLTPAELVTPAALGPVATPTVSATALDANQALTVTDTIPTTGTGPYSWTWLVSVNLAGYATATECAVDGGSGAAADATEPCNIAGNTLTAGDTYAFEFRVTDSEPSTSTSAASATVMVSAELTAGAVTPVSPTIDDGQTITLTENRAGGAAPHTYQWYSSTSDLGACSSGTALGTGHTQAATPTTNTYYCYVATDSASTPETASSAWDLVTVESALTGPGTPTVSATALDVDQSLTVMGTIPSTGTAPYAWTWLESVNGGAYVAATHCATNSGSGALADAAETCLIAASTLAVGDTYAFELRVTDGSQGMPPGQATSGASMTVSVASSLTAPGAPSASATWLDLDQPLTVTASLPSTGTSPYAWTWLVSVNGGGYVTAAECVVDSGTGASAGATETCTIPASTLTVAGTYRLELEVTDSATVAETATSVGSSTVTVSASLTAPGTPEVSVTSLDVNQALTVTGTIPTTGTSPYSWTWLVSVNGAGYATATECAVDSGTGAAGGDPETCSISANALTAGDTYAFELQVTDNATVAETATSGGSSTVTVASALTAPGAPGVSATALDVNQALTVTGTIPSTGTSTYAWTWLASVNGGAYATATECAVDSGTGAAAGDMETCTIAAGALTARGTYTFELEVTDSSDASPEMATSSASSMVTVNSALTEPEAPTVNATAPEANQALTVTGTIPSTGTAPYAWTWLVSVNGGTYDSATQCAVDSGAGALAGATEVCSIRGGTLTAGDTYAFKLQVADSATVAETQTSAASPTVTVASAVPSGTTSSGTPLWAWGIAVFGVLVALLLMLVLARRRRHPSQLVDGPGPRGRESEAASLESDASGAAAVVVAVESHDSREVGGQNALLPTIVPAEAVKAIEATHDSSSVGENEGEVPPPAAVVPDEEAMTNSATVGSPDSPETEVPILAFTSVSRAEEVAASEPTIDSRDSPQIGGNSPASTTVLPAGEAGADEVAVGSPETEQPSPDSTPVAPVGAVEAHEALLVSQDSPRTAEGGPATSVADSTVVEGDAGGITVESQALPKLGGEGSAPSVEDLLTTTSAPGEAAGISQDSPENEGQSPASTAVSPGPEVGASEALSGGQNPPETGGGSTPPAPEVSPAMDVEEGEPAIHPPDSAETAGATIPSAEVMSYEPEKADEGTIVAQGPPEAEEKGPAPSAEDLSALEGAGGEATIHPAGPPLVPGESPLSSEVSPHPTVGADEGPVVARTSLEIAARGPVSIALSPAPSAGTNAAAPDSHESPEVVGESAPSSGAAPPEKAGTAAETAEGSAGMGEPPQIDAEKARTQLTLAELLRRRLPKSPVGTAAPEAKSEGFP